MYLSRVEFSPVVDRPVMSNTHRRVGKYLFNMPLSFELYDNLHHNQPDASSQRHLWRPYPPLFIIVDGALPAQNPGALTERVKGQERRIEYRGVEGNRLGEYDQ